MGYDEFTYLDEDATQIGDDLSSQEEEDVDYRPLKAGSLFNDIADITLKSDTFTRSDTTTEISGHDYYTYTDNTNHTIQIENTIDVSWQ